MEISKIESLLVYICAKYPYKKELSVRRLIHTIYLCDWLSVLIHDKQVSDVKWYFDHYGPDSKDITQIITHNAKIFKEINSGTTRIDNIINLQKSIIGKCLFLFELDNDSKKIINKIINKTKHIYSNELMNLVYNTEPVSYGIRYQNMDLIKSKKELKLFDLRLIADEIRKLT